MPVLTLLNPSTTLDAAGLPSAVVNALYLHVPFCFHKCHYCDFYSITRQTPERMGQFVDRLLAEAAIWRDRSPLMLRPETVFFGGGTPSLLPVEEMARLLVGLHDVFDLSAVDEWTVEANPATVTKVYCRTLKAGGVDRLSFGAQSFRPADLAMLERHHEPGDISRSLAIARDAGFERLNVDMIFGIPDQTENDWAANLEQAIGLGTSHVSAYGLTYEPNTAMAVRKRLGQFLPVAENIELSMLRHARSRLAAAGLPAYEISNYAGPGQACRHNLAYWTGANYLGLGPSAASHVEGHRWRNRPHLGEWEQAIDADALPAIDVEQLESAERAGELAMLMLRLSDGIDFEHIFTRTGIVPGRFEEVARRMVALGLVRSTANGVTLTDSGLPVADAVAAEFLDV